MKLLFHVGPPKTATTSIQRLLADLRTELLEIGIFYPVGRNMTHNSSTVNAQHQIPLLLRGLNLEQSYIQSITEPLEVEFTEWVREAAKKNCSTLLLSTEAAHSMTFDQWLSFDDLLREVEGRAEVNFDEIEIFYTERNLESWMESLYRQAVHAGTQLEKEDAYPIIRQMHQDFLSVISRLEVEINSRYSIRTIDFEGGVTSSGDQQPVLSFPRRWLATIGGWNFVEAIPDGLLDRREMVGISDFQLQEIFDFNKVNLPVEEMSLFPLAGHAEGNEDLSRAQLRYHMFILEIERRNVAYEKADRLEHETVKLREQIENIYSSRSWRSTAWARSFRSRL